MPSIGIIATLSIFESGGRGIICLASLLRAAERATGEARRTMSRIWRALHSVQTPLREASSAVVYWAARNLRRVVLHRVGGRETPQIMPAVYPPLSGDGAQDVVVTALEQTDRAERDHDDRSDGRPERRPPES